MIVANFLANFEAVARRDGGSSRSGKTQILHSRRQNRTAAATIHWPHRSADIRIADRATFCTAKNRSLFRVPCRHIP